MEKITIYTNEACTYCKTMKEELTKNNIKFEEKLIFEFQEEWNKTTILTNLPTIPTIYYKNNYFVPGRDFVNPENLIKLLKSFKESEFSLPYRNNEAIKTLSYNISIAFDRLDQLLSTIQIDNKLNKIEENEHKSTS